MHDNHITITSCFKAFNSPDFLRTSFKVPSMSTNAHHVEVSINIFSITLWIFAATYLSCIHPLILKDLWPLFFIFFDFFCNSLGKPFSHFRLVSSLTSFMKLFLSLFLSLLRSLKHSLSPLYYIAQCFLGCYYAYITLYLFYNCYIHACITYITDVRYMPMLPVLHYIYFIYVYLYIYILVSLKNISWEEVVILFEIYP